MTTATLHPKMRFDADLLTRICAATFGLSGLILLALPQLVARVFQLDGASDVGIRAIGVAWLVVGVVMFIVVGRILPKWFLLSASAVLLLNALFLPVAPFLSGVHVGWFGWLVLFVLSLLSVAGATAWFFLYNRIVATEQRNEKRQAVADGTYVIPVYETAEDTEQQGGSPGPHADGAEPEQATVSVAPTPDTGKQGESTDPSP